MFGKQCSVIIVSARPGVQGGVVCVCVGGVTVMVRGICVQNVDKQYIVIFSLSYE